MKSIPEVINNYDLITLPADKKVFSQGQSCGNYIVVTSGTVKVYARSPMGKELVLYRIKPGEICVLTTACLMGSTQYPAEALTETEVEARVISFALFNKLLAESAEFREFIFNSFSQRLTDLLFQIEQLSFESIEQRLKLRLLSTCDLDNNVTSTHQDIAVEIGSAREVVSRHLKMLEKQQLIKLNRGSIELLDKDGLKQSI